MIALVIAAATTIGASSTPRQDVVPPPPPVVRIGDDVCAIMLDVRCRVTDQRGQPVEGAELSGLHQWMKTEGDWHSIGVTDAAGQVQGRFCLQSSSVYLKAPPVGLVTLAFRVVKTGHSYPELQEVVNADRLLGDELLFRKKREAHVVPDIAAIKRKAAYRVRLRAREQD